MKPVDSTHTTPPAPPGRKPARVRILLILLLAATGLFAGHTIYFRNKIDTQLQLALEKIETQPQFAYKDIEPLLLIRHVPTFGHVEQARDIFFDALQDSIIHELLHARQIHPQVYERAYRAAVIYKDYSELSGEDMTERSRRIVEAVRDSAERIKNQGTLTTWDELMLYFMYMDHFKLIPKGVFENFDAWMAEQDRVSRRDLGIRDCIQQASSNFFEAMNPMWPAKGPRGNSGTLTVPAMLSDQSLNMATAMLNKTLASLSIYKTKFRLEEEPAMLWPIFTLVHHNITSLKLGHLMDFGAGAQVFGTQFISESVLPIYMNEVPTTEQQYGDFLKSVRADLERVEFYMQHDSTLDPVVSRQYQKLHEHNREIFREIENIYSAGPLESPAEFTTTRPQLIVEFPPM